MTTAVWYAAFGSNLSRSRFDVYLTGGPVPGSTNGRVQDGARDPSPPSGDEPFTIPHTLVFSGEVAQWGGGGTASVDLEPNPITPTFGRAYRITVEQFEDVVRQENRLDQPPAVDLATLMATGRADLADRKYGTAIVVGAIAREPVVTITSASAPARLTPAHHSYLSTMAQGLSESWRLPLDAIVDYLAGRPGNAGMLDPRQLATTLGE